MICLTVDNDLESVKCGTSNSLFLSPLEHDLVCSSYSINTGNEQILWLWILPVGVTDISNWERRTKQ